jgi:hypothetical protein
MDAQGNLYLTKMGEQDMKDFLEMVNSVQLVDIPEPEVEEVIGMNRAERRAYYRRQRRKGRPRKR